ncbi:MAG: hypothetical protein ACREXX_09800 [Gammaproteobacteria bacterium]
MANPPLPPGDDPTIPDTATLWRRIHPDWWVFDKKTGNRRLSTAAFDNAPDGSPMLVGLADEMPGTEALLSGYESYGVAAFTAGHARHMCAQAVARAPVPDRPWHAHVIGRKTGSVTKRLRDGSAVVVIPDTPEVA